MSELRRYVPGTALSWPGPDLLDEAGLHRHVDGTLVFVDVSGFTALSERLAQRGKVGAEQLTDVLNAVFGTMLGLAGARGGSLLKFGGDALFLLFTGDNHAAQASAAAVEMRSALAATAKTPGPAGRLRLRMSVGVHTGEVDLFLVGSSHRELVIVGPATTAVAEMEAAASAGQILIGPSTAAALPPGAVGDPLGPGYLLRWRRPHTALPEPHRRPAEGIDVARFVPTALRELLAAGDPESEHRTVGVSFIRYTGIDALLDEHGHQATADALHTLVSASQESADAEGVTFLATDLAEDGGKVILVGGFPTTAEDDQGRLLRATRAIVQRSVEESWPIAVRGGLNRGHVFAGAIGSAERATVTVMGDTVNLAARVMARADAGTVLATPATLDNAQTLFATEPVEPFMVKGKSRPVTAYVVGTEAGTRPPRTLGSLPFLGRDAELRVMAEAIEGLAQANRGRHHDLRGDRDREDSLVTRGPGGARPGSIGPRPSRAVRRGHPVPTTAGSDTAASRFGQSSADELPRWLAETVPLLAPDLEPWLPLIGDVLAIPARSPATKDLDPKFRPDRTADALIRLIGVLAGGPMMLTLDDAHHADEATAALMTRFEREVQTRPWLILADSTRGQHRLPAHDRIVHPARTARFAVGRHPGDRGHRRCSAPSRPDRSSGRQGRRKPALPRKTLLALREHGDVDALPSSLEGMVAAQIDALSPLARGLVRRASVLGRSFRVGVLKDLFTDEEVALDNATEKELADVLEPGRQGATTLQARRCYETPRTRGCLFGAGGSCTCSPPSRHADGRSPSQRSTRTTWRCTTGWAGTTQNAWHWALFAESRPPRPTRTPPQRLSSSGLSLLRAGWATFPRGDLRRTYEALGTADERAGKFEEAIAAFREAYRLCDVDTCRVELLLRRARAHERAGAYRSAHTRPDPGVLPLSGGWRRTRSEALCTPGHGLHGSRPLRRAATTRHPERLLWRR